VDIFDLGVGMAGGKGSGGIGPWDFSLRADFRESGAGGGAGFGGRSSTLVGGGSAEVGGCEKMEARVGQGGVMGRGRFGNGGIGCTCASGFGGEGMGWVAWCGGVGGGDGDGVAGGGVGGVFFSGGVGSGVVEGFGGAEGGSGGICWSADLRSCALYSSGGGLGWRGRVGGGVFGVGEFGVVEWDGASLEIGGFGFDWIHFGKSGLESAIFGGRNRAACRLGGGGALGGECLPAGAASGGGMVGSIFGCGAVAFSSSFDRNLCSLGATDSCDFGLRRSVVSFSL